MKLKLKDPPSNVNTINIYNANSHLPFASQNNIKNNFIQLNKKKKKNYTRVSSQTSGNIDRLNKKDPFCSSNKIILFTVFGFLGALIFIFVILETVAFSMDMVVEYVHPNYNGDIVINIFNKVKINNVKIYYANKWFDKITLAIDLNNPLNLDFKLIYDDSKYENITINLPADKYTLIIQAKSGWNSQSIYKEVSVIKNKKIIVAALSQIMPITVVTLKIKEITNNFTIPLYVILERMQSWNFNNLPPNVNLIHSYNESDLVSNSLPINVMYERLKEWIRLLQNSYPDLAYDFYFSDQYSYAFLEFVYILDLKKQNFKFYFVTVGATSSRNYNYKYDIENWKENYEYYKSNYLKAINQINSLGYYDARTNVYKMTDGYFYMFVILSENNSTDNYYWIVNNLKLLGPDHKEDPNGSYLTKLKYLIDTNKIIEAKLSQIFNALSDEEKDIIKNLYHFSKDMFSEAYNNAKDAVILLGTMTYEEPYIDKYIEATKDYYGTDKFAYFYKGHPNDNGPIENKKQRFNDNYNVTWLDASIPAELIYFMTDGKIINGRELHTFFAGYASGTFDSINQNHFLCGWDMSLKYYSNTAAKTYIYNFDFLLMQSDTKNTSYGSISVPSENNNYKCFILEYVKDASTKGFTHSVYYFINGTFKHFKYIEENKFEEYTNEN